MTKDKIREFYTEQQSFENGQAIFAKLKERQAQEINDRNQKALYLIRPALGMTAVVLPFLTDIVDGEAAIIGAGILATSPMMSDLYRKVVDLTHDIKSEVNKLTSDQSQQTGNEKIVGRGNIYKPIEGRDAVTDAAIKKANELLLASNSTMRREIIERRYESIPMSAKDRAYFNNATQSIEKDFKYNLLKNETEDLKSALIESRNGKISLTGDGIVEINRNNDINVLKAREELVLSTTPK